MVHGNWAGVSLLSFLGMLVASGLNREYDIDTPHAIWILYGYRSVWWNDDVRRW